MTGTSSYADWVEILCESKVTIERIRAIQMALKQKGYNPGPIDNVLDRQTKTALLQFQKMTTYHRVILTLRRWKL